MTISEIWTNNNIIKDISNSNVDEDIFLSWWNDFNYFLYGNQSNAKLYFQTWWEDIVWNIFVMLYWTWDSSWNIQVDIKHSNCNINVFILSLLQDDNFIDVDGNITVGKSVSNSQWHLMEKNIILWKKVKTKMSPRLDVYSSDVSATHWVSIDKIAWESLLYLESRGLSYDDSQNLLISWYIKNILEYFVDIDTSEKDNIERTILFNLKL